MADICHVPNCRQISYDNCKDCRRATCRKHGQQEGDDFRCWDCINNGKREERPRTSR
jgi:hypothetical protein